MILISLIFLAITLLWWRWRSSLRSSNGVPLPPGPPRDPIIGNLRIIPLQHTYKWFYELSKTYGKIVSLQVPGKAIIVVNSAKIAADLLDKRGAVYSERPVSTMMLMMGWLKTLVFMQYGKDWVKHRKLLNEYFDPATSRSYEPYQAIVAQRLVKGLFENPGNFATHINRFTAATIVYIIQGHEILTDDDEYIKVLAGSGYCIGNCPIPFNNPLDLFPILQYFPSWFPGTYTATIARKFRPTVDRCHNYPFYDMKAKMEKGVQMQAEGSFLYRHIEGLEREGDSYPYTVDDILGATGVSYTAGSDTSWSTILIFILCMVHHPEEQAKAQEELDRVLGGDRLPQFEDRDNLPYMEALLQESYRWNNAVPLGVPHECMEDDVYEGMFIPKGSIIIANTHGIALDSDIYSDPHKFDPTRYLDDRREPHLASQYGFGRRICPGKFVADTSVWIAAASMLAAFTISSPSEGAQGRHTVPDSEESYTAGVVCHPKSFACEFRPRNKIASQIAAAAAAALVESEA